MYKRALVGVLLAAVGVQAAEFPEATVSTPAITAKFHLPDPEKGYYRGTRFDWSGQIYSLKANGHEYFGQWNDKYDPKLHDAIQGPVEEFKTNGSGLGYNDAKVGDTFIRIGVGTVRKPEEAQFTPFKTYEIVDHGKWNVRQGKDHIEFTHELNDGKGYAYRYVKTVRLAKDKPVMVIEHSLRNTGTKPIPTQQYNHNFFMIDHKPTGPASTVVFPFALKADGRKTNPELARIDGGKLTYVRELEKGESVFFDFTGFGRTAADYDVRVENSEAGAGVRIQGDRPIENIVYWSIRSTLCPELYIGLNAEPGQEVKWKYTYTFYELPVAKRKSS